MFADQTAYAIRFDWGGEGLAAIGAGVDTVVIVDVLSFTTCVDVAVGRGAVVYPFTYKDRDRIAEFAASKLAVAAGRRGQAEYSLSPVSLAAIPSGTKLVLASPNGATLTLACRFQTVYAGCLRNAKAVANALTRRGGTVAVIAAGERWADGPIRFAIEDLLGAGAIIAGSTGTKSPEAVVAEEAFRSAFGRLAGTLRESASGQQLIEGGYPGDVEMAAALDISDALPRFDAEQGAFR